MVNFFFVLPPSFSSVSIFKFSHYFKNLNLSKVIKIGNLVIKEINTS